MPDTAKKNIDPEFETQFEKILPLIYTASKRYRIRLWQLDDYIQEGMIIFHQLIQSPCPEEKWLIYFKVKFNQHLINIIRRQAAFKRKFDQGNYVDLDAVASKVADESYVIDSELLVNDTMSAFIEQLRRNDKEVLLKLVNGTEVSRSQKHRLRQKLLKFLDEDSAIG